MSNGTGTTNSNTAQCRRQVIWYFSIVFWRLTFDCTRFEDSLVRRSLISVFSDNKRVKIQRFLSRGRGQVMVLNEFLFHLFLSVRNDNSHWRICRTLTEKMVFVSCAKVLSTSAINCNIEKIEIKSIERRLPMINDWFRENLVRSMWEHNKNVQQKRVKKTTKK